MDLGSLSPVSLSWLDVAARFAAAAGFALTIGIERFMHRKPVDFRPFVIIAAASCALAIAILEIGRRSTDPNLSVDPAKVISGVMTGIGFLGAGALFHQKHFVQGAGSAASIWAAGAIGLVCGLGVVWLGGVIAVVVVATLLAGRGLVSDYDARPESSDQGEPSGGDHGGVGGGSKRQP